MHHPHEDVLVITTKIANSLIHWLLVDSGSIVNILYWNAYQKIGLKRDNLRPTNSPFYGFTEESVISEGTIKLVVTLREAPQMATTVIDLFVVNYPSSFNRVLGIPLLKTLKSVTSIHCLMMKFPTTAGTGQVRGR